MKWSANSSRGKVRPENEDSWTVQSFQDGWVLAIVADGMGGVDGGEIASSLAVKYCSDYVIEHRNEEQPGDLLRNAIQFGNRKVYEASATSFGAQGMGTTLTGLYAKDGDNRVYVGHVGDSRAYVMNPHGIRLITEDQSITGELVRTGAITEEDAMRHPGRNVLTAALGTQISVDVSIYRVDLSPDEVVILCTDGLTSLLSSKEVHKIAMDSSKDKAAEDLVNAANDRGGYDNVTVIMLWPEVTASPGGQKRW